MKRFTLSLPEEDYEQLKTLAEENRIPVAVKARSMIAQKLQSSQEATNISHEG